MKDDKILKITDLRAQWQEIWQIKPHNRIGRKMLERSLYFKRHEKQLPTHTQKRLNKLIQNYKRNPQYFEQGNMVLKPGMKILRDWKGKTHMVTVASNGFRYNDKEYSKLIKDITAGKVQTVVVYKIDRLTRSLTDFSKLVEVFDEHGVTFVSVTQSFNTTTSMGRLTLNVLLSFAQFEREVTGERIRDKIAASKKKGMWMGGFPPLGYQRIERKLTPDPIERKTVNFIFNEYLSLKSVRLLSELLADKNFRTPHRVSKKGRQYGGKNYSRGHIYKILNNPVYIGKVRHKDKTYEGQHKAIIEGDIFEKVQHLLNEQSVVRATKWLESGQLLKGLLYDVDGTIYSPTYTSKGKKRYSYYISQNLLQYRDHPKGVLARIPAHEIEKAVVNGLKSWLSDDRKLPELFTSTAAQNLQWVSDQHLELNHEDLRGMLNKVILSHDQFELRIDSYKLHQYLTKTLDIALEKPAFKEVVLSIPFNAKRVNNGALIIEADNGSIDMLDIPADQLARIVKGIVWRDEHFAGSTLTLISKKYKHGEYYIHRCIHESFEFLSNKFPVI